MWANPAFGFDCYATRLRKVNLCGSQGLFRKQCVPGNRHGLRLIRFPLTRVVCSVVAHLLLACQGVSSRIKLKLCNGHEFVLEGGAELLQQFANQLVIGRLHNFGVTLSANGLPFAWFPAEEVSMLIITDDSAEPNVGGFSITQGPTSIN